ncbi:DUF4352 domain-containing protein [Patescibacteria group bacterium]|nr:DUF4352 domain-containing protein [Patescibacteria group bacterium]
MTIVYKVSLIAEAPEGEEYAIVTLTINNLQNDKTYSFSSLLVAVYDEDGFQYESDFTALTALKQGLVGGEILPGKKLSGKIPYLVPVGADIELHFKYDIFGGTTAVFDLS